MNMTSARIRFIAACVLICTFGGEALSQDMQHRHDATSDAKAPVFVASSAKPFAALMDDAMAVMDAGMKRAPMNGIAEHDFVTMMIPHHQGAVDMAKALLIYTKDPELRNVAQGIITEQLNEIRVMQAWLRRHQSPPAKVAPTPIIKKD